MKLEIGACTFEQVKFACRKWHYSKSVPSGKLFKLGVWENDVFVGCVIFSHGATPNIASPYGLTQYQVCELTRVALTTHATPVSRIVAICLRILKKQNPGLKLVVSYADTDQGHEGIIYRAGNWKYEGLVNKNTRGAFIVFGRKVHPRSIGAAGGVQSLKWIRENLDPRATEYMTKGKHKFVFPL